MGEGDIHLEIHEVGKSFGGTRALDGVSIAINAGSVHAFVGENGAGKSTLGKIVAGVFPPDQGQLSLRGEPVSFRSPREALQRGIALVAQEVAVVPQRTVAENVFLGNEPRRLGFVQRRRLRERFEQLVADTGLVVPADAVVGSLPLAMQQQVEILRALARDAALIVFDEPTAALSATEVQRFHEIVRGLAAGGRTVILVSHFLGEVLSLSDTVTVLRDGKVVKTSPAAGETEDTLMAAMLGRSVSRTYPPKQPPAADAPSALTVRDLTAVGVTGASLEIRAGEIVALAGLVGAGRSELARAIFGASPATAGEMTAGATRLTGTPLGSLRANVTMIPESRKDDGLMLRRPVRENVSLASLRSLGRFGFVRRGMESTRAKDALRQVAASGELETIPAALSGGNQQKLMFARALLAHPAVLIADEPTRGVDVGAKRDIYELIVEPGRGRRRDPAHLQRDRGGPGARPPGRGHARRADLRRALGRRHHRGGDPRRLLRPGERGMTSTTSIPETARVSGRVRAQSLIRRGGILIPFVIAFVILSVVSGPFLRFQNLANILDQQSGIIIVAAAGTLVLIAGGIDLSIGAIYGLAGATAAQLAVSFGTPVGILAGVAVGLIIGLANGVIVTRFRINALIGTLAMSFVVGGIGAIATHGNLVVLFDHPEFQAFAATKILGLTSAAWMMIIVAVAMAILLSRTTFGRYVYATGGNAEAARLGGVRINTVRVATFALSGAAAALAGTIDASRVLSAQASAGSFLTFTVLTGIIVGGTSIMGGEGSVQRTVLGCLFIALVANGFNLLGLDPYYQQITLGIILLLAVGTDAWSRRQA